MSDYLRVTRVCDLMARYAEQKISRGDLCHRVTTRLATMNGRHLTRLWPEIGAIGTSILEQLSIDAQYAVYLERQRSDVEAMRRDEGVGIPDWLDYAQIPGLSNELKAKLAQHRPTTLAQAQAIEGMTPAAATLLLAIIRRGALRKAG